MSTTTAFHESVTVVGAGTMGSRVVRAFAEAGHPVIAIDIAEQARARAAAINRVIAADRLTADHLAGPAPRLILLSLPDPAAVGTVVTELVPLAPTGSVVVDLSTIDPGTARDCARKLAPTGVTYLDCPILGRPAGVGGWTVVVGGDAEAAAPIESLLTATIARRVLPAGAIGLACIVKLMNNLMFGAINAITAEVMTVCAAAGLNPGTFVDTVVESGAASVSGLFKDIAPRIVAGDFAPTFSLALLHKDNGLAVALADEYRVPLMVGHSVQDLNTMALVEHGEADSAAVIRTLEALTGVQVRKRADDDRG